MQVNGSPYTVIGVAEEGFSGTHFLLETDALWSQLHTLLTLSDTVSHYAFNTLIGSTRLARRVGSA